MKKGISIILAVILGLSLIMASGMAVAETTEPKTLTVAGGSMDGSMDPAGFALSTWNLFARMCSLPLLSFNASGEEVMGAAESYTVSDDQLTWTFTLRADGKWSDGSDVTAADFVNTIQRALDPENSESIYAEMLYGLVGAQEANKGTGAMDAVGATATDDHTLVFQLTQPCPYFTKLLSLPVFYPSKVGVATNENKTWYKDPATNLCNGAFMLTEYVQDQYYTVARNPYYFDAANVKLDTIVNRSILDTQSTIAAYESGEVQACSGLPDYVETQYAGSKELTIWNMLTTTAILPNVDVEPLNNEKVREAIGLALNRQAICASMGTNYEPSYTWVPKYMLSNVGDKFFSEEETPFTEDAAKAQTLLAEAGYPGGANFPVLSYTYPSSDKDAILAQAIQAQLKAVLGIDITLVAQETEVYNATKREGTFQLLRYNWTADFNDPINYLALYTSDSSLNYVHMKDAAYDEAIAASNAATDPAERNAYLHTAQKILINDNFYVIPISTMHYIGLCKENVTGITYNDKGELIYTYCDIN
ncbi:MAG TPA: peptide ABC transporter substrate-binding protein [Candidatus Limiplasma sp.]|nr:peptide ABC transporter substrate-binding protein [Candidatus Limiplasma sp.]